MRAVPRSNGILAVTSKLGINYREKKAWKLSGTLVGGKAHDYGSPVITMVPIAMMLANTMRASKTARISLIEATSWIARLGKAPVKAVSLTSGG